ncbi:type IV pilus secretin PilQ [Allopseudospirillum japonicum]|nr:type IV pilus secretin PilQ [Allopseudospirillum japonicum]
MFSKISLVRWMLIVGLVFTTYQAHASQLKQVRFISLPGNQLEVRLEFDQGLPSYSDYLIKDPARIVLDLQGTDNQLDSRYFELGLMTVRSISVLEAQNTTRLVFKLNQSQDYRLRATGQMLVITIGEPEALAATDKAPKPAPPAAKPAASTLVDTSQQAVTSTPPTAPTQSVPEVTHVAFQRGEKGQAQVKINLSDPKVRLDVARVGKDISVHLPDLHLPQHLQKRLDVLDFATSVQYVDIRQIGNDVLIQLRNQGDFSYLAYQTDTQLTIDVHTLTREESDAERRALFPYTGEKINLSFQNVDVRSILQLLAENAEKNLVVSDSVEGDITLQLREVPWDQALDIVLRTKGLDKRDVGNVLMIMQLGELAEMEQKVVKANKQSNELAPLITEYLQIRYAKAKEIVDLLNEGKGSDGASGLLTGRGFAIVDQRTNTLIIRDTAEKLSEVRQLLSRLDMPVRQVQIDARLVIARTNVNKELGVRWGASNIGKNVSYTPLNPDGTQADDPVFVVDGANIGMGPVSIDSFTNSFTFGYLGKNILLDLELSAIESDGRGEIISQPKVITADQKKAIIKAGKQIPYEEATASGATNIEFKDAVLSLEVTPQITPDDRIIMDLKITQDSVAEILPNGSPAIDTNSVETQVLVGNGETVVLGGVFKSELVNKLYKTPFLGDLPVVGNLFRSSSDQHEKVELLIFITPKLIDDTLAVY